MGACGGEDLTVAAGFSAGQPLAPRDRVEMRLSRSLLPEEGRIAVFIGETDVSRLLTVADTKIAYQPNVLPLPVGESQVVVYVVSPGNAWKEAARFPFRVESLARPQADIQTPRFRLIKTVLRQALLHSLRAASWASTERNCDRPLPSPEVADGGVAFS